MLLRQTPAFLPAAEFAAFAFRDAVLLREPAAFTPAGTPRFIAAASLAFAILPAFPVFAGAGPFDLHKLCANGRHRDAIDGAGLSENGTGNAGGERKCEDHGGLTNHKKQSSGNYEVKLAKLRSLSRWIHLQARLFFLSRMERSRQVPYSAGAGAAVTSRFNTALNAMAQAAMTAPKTAVPASTAGKP